LSTSEIADRQSQFVNHFTHPSFHRNFDTTSYSIELISLAPFAPDVTSLKDTKFYAKAQARELEAKQKMTKFKFIKFLCAKFGNPGGMRVYD
jgi:hypothetical protein